MSQTIKDFYEDFHNGRNDRVVEFMTQKKYKFLKNLLSKQRGKILIVGCGSKDEMSILNPQCHGIGLDISKNAINKSRRKYPQFEYVQGNALNLPFQNESIDYIVCSEVIEHLPDSEQLIKEASRILKSKQRLILTTPNWISWYGLARKIGELLLAKPLTSGDQPIDHWYTYWTLKKEAEKYFTLINNWGFWYFPPLGKGKLMIPDTITLPLVKLLNPIDSFFSRILPLFGHCLIFDLQKNT